MVLHLCLVIGGFGSEYKNGYLFAHMLIGRFISTSKSQLSCFDLSLKREIFLYLAAWTSNGFIAYIRRPIAACKITRIKDL